MKASRKIFALFALAALLSPLSAFALFEDCQDLFPKQRVPITQQAGRDLCFDSFAIYYSPTDKKPIYTVEKLSREQLSAPHPKRTNQFYEEARVPLAERALLSDYRGSGYDRGHNVPAGDMTNERSMAQSFSLANMMPQARQNNQGIWAKNVEEPTRLYVKRATGDVYVYTGSVGNSGSIGSGPVLIFSYPSMRKAHPRRLPQNLSPAGPSSVVGTLSFLMTTQPARSTNSFRTLKRVV